MLKKATKLSSNWNDLIQGQSPPDCEKVDIFMTGGTRQTDVVYNGGVFIDHAGNKYGNATHWKYPDRPDVQYEYISTGKPPVVVGSLEHRRFLKAKSALKVQKSAYVISDIQPYKSMQTGEMIGSRSTHREHLRKHKLIEIGNEDMSKHVKKEKTGEKVKDSLLRTYHEMKR